MLSHTSAKTQLKLAMGAIGVLLLTTTINSFIAEMQPTFMTGHVMRWREASQGKLGDARLVTATIKLTTQVQTFTTETDIYLKVHAPKYINTYTY